MNKVSAKNWSKIGLIYASLVWGSTFFFVKERLDHIHPVALIAHRFLIAAFLTALLVLYRKQKLWKDFSKGAVLGFFLWIAFSFQTFGLKITSASNSGFITGLYVPLVPIVAILLFRRKPTPNQWLAVVLSLLGLWVLTGGVHSGNFGDLLTLGTAVSIAFHILYSEKYVRKKIDPFVLSFQQFLVVALLSYLHAAIRGHSLVVVDQKMGWSLLFLACFPTVSAFAIQTFAQKHLEAITVALLFTLEPVFAAFFSWGMGGEPFHLQQALGGLLIIAGMIISEFDFTRYFTYKTSLH